MLSVNNHRHQRYQEISQIMHFQFILFDAIGTTIQDTNANGSLILKSFQQAFSQHGIVTEKAQLNQQRGKRKREAINTILKEVNLNTELTNSIYHSFLELLNNNASAFTEVPKASEVFETLRAKGIKIGIGSGLPLSFMQTLITQLNWRAKDFDYIGSSDDLSAGRPNPIMILEAMQQLDITNPTEVLKIGDTKVDILEGKNANVQTAFVKTGTQKIDTILPLQPNYIFDSVADLIPLLGMKKQ